MEVKMRKKILIAATMIALIMAFTPVADAKMASLSELSQQTQEEIKIYLEGKASIDSVAIDSMIVETADIDTASIDPADIETCIYWFIVAWYVVPWPVGIVMLMWMPVICVM